MIENNHSLGGEQSGHIIFGTVNVKVKSKAAVREDQAVMKVFTQLEQEIGQDGRLLLRENGTEPVIRVMVEAKTDEICRQVVDAM